MNTEHLQGTKSVMRRRLGHAYASVALLIAGMGVGPTLGQESQNPPPRDRTSEFLQKMNERQRMHAHLFQDPDYTRRLLDTLQSINETSMYFLTPEEIDQKEQFRQLFCSSDAVFGGVVKTSESFPTETGTFLFTEYTLLSQTSFGALQSRNSTRSSWWYL